jgi:penicillin-insensitive murein endopeptidase
MRFRFTVAALLIGVASAGAQTPPVPVPQPKPAPAETAAAAAIPAKTSARELFGNKTEPAPMQARSIGFYAHGCLAGAVALPVDGKTWQVMRLSRNRNWGHPDLIAFLERFSAKLPQVAGWPGIMVGDISQPRGGPMLTGHASHQVGLDADIWLTPMPAHSLSTEERETVTPLMMVREDRTDIDPNTWTPSHLKVIKAAAEDPVVERIFVNAAIKKALCREVTGDRAWLDKVRAYWGHDYHMHVRIRCPEGDTACEKQPPVPANDGCGKELEWWFQPSVLHNQPSTTPPKRKPITMADLPAACRQVLVAP